MRKDANDSLITLWSIALGATAGVAAGLLLSRRFEPPRPLARFTPTGRLELEVLDALKADPVLGGRAIEVGALTEDIVELTGFVRNSEEAHRAVELARGVTGVRTVLNRLDTENLATHLDETRRRFESGDPALHEPHWYGMGVGMGRRRQSEATDPPRPDDHTLLQARALGTDHAVDEASEELSKRPGGVEGHSTLPAGPTDRGGALDTEAPSPIPGSVLENG